MDDVPDKTLGALYGCERCRQMYRTDHPFRLTKGGGADVVLHPDDARVVVRPGDAIPGGMRMAGRIGCIPEPVDDPTAWSSVEGGDLVYDLDADRVVGIVGHFDDQALDVERLTDGSLRVERVDCYGDGRYRVIRL